MDQHGNFPEEEHYWPDEHWNAIRPYRIWCFPRSDEYSFDRDLNYLYHKGFDVVSVKWATDEDPWYYVIVKVSPSLCDRPVCNCPGPHP